MVKRSTIILTEFTAKWNKSRDGERLDYSINPILPCLLNSVKSSKLNYPASCVNIQKGLLKTQSEREGGRYVDEAMLPVSRSENGLLYNTSDILLFLVSLCRFFARAFFK